MRRHYINSSVFKSEGYDKKTNVLELEFRGKGDVWQYHNFPPSAYKKFIEASSRGHFFTAEIRDKYPEVKIE